MNFLVPIVRVVSFGFAPEIPIESGRVSIGSLGGRARFFLIESRNWPGHWYDMDIRANTIACRPTSPERLRRYLNEHPVTRFLCWTTHIDIGGAFADGERSNAA